MSPTPRHPDVLILGAGLAGTSLAWHLAGHCQVQLIEQGPGECLEASAQNAGMLRRLVASTDGRRLACRTWEFLQDPPTDDWEEGSPFHRTGSIVAIAQPTSSEARTLSSSARWLREKGVQIEKLEGADIGAVAPALEGSPLSHAYWTPSDGVCDPRALGRGFLRGATRRGVDARFGVRVVNLLREHGRITGVLTDEGTLRAGVVVLASAAWTPRLLAQFGLHSRVRPTARHLFLTAQHPLSRADHPWCWIEDAKVYARPDNGAFMCSPCDEVEVPAPLGPGSTAPPNPEILAQMRTQLARHFPAISSIDIIDGWTGLRTFGPGRHSMVGPDPDLFGLFWMTALGGTGLSTSFAIGERVARALLSSQRPTDSDEGTTRP